MAEVVIDVVGRDSFSGTLGNFGNIMTGIQSALSLAADAARLFGSAFSAGFEAVADWERLGMVLESLVAKELMATGSVNNMAHALQQAAPAAEELAGWVEQLAIKSPFTSEGVADALRMAMAYGFTVDEAKRLTQALIDFAAGSGASESAMSRIALALGQISATGRVTGGDMLQLVNAGLPVAEILAEGFGKTTAEIMDMRQKGLLPAQESLEIITRYLEDNFAGAAERQSLSWAGLKATFQDITTIGLRTFFMDTFDALQPLAIALAEFLQGPGMERLDQMGATLGQWAGVFADSVLLITSGGKLYELGAALQALDGTDSFFYALGTSIRVFQQAIDDGEGARDAFNTAMEKFTQLTGFEFSAGGLVEWADNRIGEIADGLSTAIDEWVEGDGPQQLSDQIITFLNNLGRGENAEREFDDAALRLFTSLTNAIGEIRWAEMAAAMDGAVARSIEGNDWNETGEAFREGLGTIFSGTGEAGGFDVGLMILQLFTAPGVATSNFMTGTRIGQAITEGLQDFISGFVPDLGPIDWSLTFTEGSVFDNVETWLAETFFGTTPEMANVIIGNWFKDLGRGAMEGFSGGLDDVLFDIGVWVDENIVKPVKDFLGISSPSTLFAQIGRDVVLGLMQGLAGMLGSLSVIGLTLAQSFVTTVVGKFGELRDRIGEIFERIKTAWNDSGLAGVLDALNIEWPDWPSGTTGTVGSGPGDTSHTPRGGVPGESTGGTVTNIFNFYGPVYMSNVGPEGTYDCPSPHPLLAASSQSLITSTIG